jgi:hypothetical protein
LMKILGRRPEPVLRACGGQAADDLDPAYTDFLLPALAHHALWPVEALDSSDAADGNNISGGTGGSDRRDDTCCCQRED